MCARLAAAGWGLPTEYLAAPVARALCLRWTGRAPAAPEALGPDYGAALLRQRSRNGVFALKLFAHQAGRLRRCFGDAPPARVAIRLSRRDRAAHVLSLLAVYLTREPWEDATRFAEIPAPATIDERFVAGLHRWIATSERSWDRRLVGLAGVARIATEDLAADPDREIARIGRALSPPLPRPLPGPPPGPGPASAAPDRHAALKAELRARFGALLDRLEARRAEAAAP